MGFWRRTLLIFGIIVVISAILLGAVEIYLYSQNRMFALQIPKTSFILSMGKIPKSTFPQSIEQSFTKMVQNNQIVRVPLYVDDMIVDSEDNGDLWAHDIRTGERRLYHWTDEAAYVCVDPQKIRISTNEPNFVQPDPKETLSNYKFFYSEYGNRGDQHRQGFYHFEADIEAGDPIKLILKDRVPEADGGFNIIGIFLFTNNKDCASGQV